MPYAEKICGIYKITDTVAGKAYVGQSRNVHKRIADHFNLLRSNKHPNPKLQNAFNKRGESAFRWELEVECVDPADLNDLENAFLSGDAVFDEPLFFNIAGEAQAAMAGRKHTEATKRKISEAKKANPPAFTDAQLQRMKEGQLRRVFSNPELVARIRFIVENPELTYAERGRRVGITTTSARKLFLKYSHLRGEF